MGKTTAFWKWSYTGANRHGRTLVRAVDEEWSRYKGCGLWIGRRKSAKAVWQSPPPVFRILNKFKVVEDLLLAVEDYYLVSPRLREFLEKEAPGAAEFLPIRIEGPGSDRLPPYWAINFMRVFSCLDEDESINTDETGRRFVEVPVIDPSKVPPDGVLGLLGGFQVLRLMRHDLKRKYEEQKFLGGFFSKVASIDRPESINWVMPDNSGLGQRAKQKRSPKVHLPQKKPKQ